MVEIGQVVIYIDPHGMTHDALITAIWGEETYPQPNVRAPSLNLVYVVKDKDKVDPYGRQIERATSIVHRDNQEAPSNCWILK